MARGKVISKDLKLTIVELKNMEKHMMNYHVNMALVEVQ